MIVRDVPSPRHLVQRHADLISRVKAQIEAENRLHRGDRAGKVLSWTRGIQDGGVVAEQMNGATL